MKASLCCLKPYRILVARNDLQDKLLCPHDHNNSFVLVGVKTSSANPPAVGWKCAMDNAPMTDKPVNGLLLHKGLAVCHVNEGPDAGPVACLPLVSMPTVHVRAMSSAMLWLEDPGSARYQLLELLFLGACLMLSLSMQAPAPDAAPAVTVESIPVVTISYALPDLTLDSFTPDLKQSLVDAIIDALPSTSNVDVYLTNIRSGSVTFDTVISFLDGNTDTAQALSDSVAASATVSPLTTTHGSMQCSR